MSCWQPEPRAINVTVAEAEVYLHILGTGAEPALPCAFLQLAATAEQASLLTGKNESVEVW